MYDASRNYNNVFETKTKHSLAWLRHQFAIFENLGKWILAGGHGGDRRQKNKGKVLPAVEGNERVVTWGIPHIKKEDWKASGPVQTSPHLNMPLFPVSRFS